MKIAVIGSGISGLSAAYLLDRVHDVTVFEKEDYLGGHARTVMVRPDGADADIPVDTGFIVFNYRNYPLLAQLFAELDVPVQKSDMSFGLTVDEGWLEYGTPKIWNVFAQKRNIARRAFWRMMGDVLRFYRQSPRFLERGTEFTLGECLDELGMGSWFRQYYLMPMGAAIWSCPPETMLSFPATTFIRFFMNHGLLTLNDQPQWYTVTNRSKTYVNNILQKISGEHYKNYAVNKIKRNLNGLQVYYGDDNEFFSYDKVIIATHADDALKLIDSPLEEEIKILSNFKYKKNIAYIHFDESIMPKNKKNWCSWNSSVDKLNVNNNAITYWLNLLQNLKVDKNIFLTLNPYLKIDEEKIFKKVTFTHPYYDQNTLNNQKNLLKIQNKNSILFCGSYFGYGFHEDGIKSSIEMIKKLYDK